jgi:preflagellin peptidase FlaK
LEEILDVARVILSLSFLLYASWSDWKQREVSNKVWIIFAPLAFSLTITQFALFAQDLLLTYLLSFAITSVMAVALFYAGAFGGADAKALMCIALALPTPVRLMSSVSLFLPIFPFTVFSNAVLLAALTAVYALFRNLVWRLRAEAGLLTGFENESVWRKITVLITGYKVKPATLEKSPHSYPLEDIIVKENGETQRKLLTFPKDETRETIVARILSASRDGKIQNGVWVTPGLPLLIFITAGLIIALLAGDLVWIILRFFLASP